MVFVRYDKRIPARRFSDRLVLLILSLLYTVYVVYKKRIHHVEKNRITDYRMFFKQIANRRVFLIEIAYYPEIRLFCRLGHEIDNLLVPSYEDKVRLSFTPDNKDTVIDVGAHLGEYTVAAAKKALKVIAIEPNPDTFKLLRKNLIINRISNVIIVNKAVYDSQGDHTLLVFGDKTGMGSMVLKYEDNFKEIKVITNTLDNILFDLQISKVDWIKVDVEGAEVHVLKGARETIMTNRDHIKLIIESHSDENTVIIKEMINNQFHLNCEMLDKNHILARLK